ncbi:MAG: PQQ-binding-like beta-propeller repeat protein [Pyrinomonadaceae bacterium]
MAQNELPSQQIDSINAQTDRPTPRKSLRLWPGVVIVILQWLAWFVVPLFGTQGLGYGMLGGALFALALIVWWLFFSRAPWVERVGFLVLTVVALIATKRVVHESIAGGGMGYLLYVLSIPIMSLALVAWAVGSRRLSTRPRRVAMVATILLACGLFTLVRTGGATGEFDNDLHLRWTKTPEQQFLAQTGDEAPAAPATLRMTTAAGTEADWPGFRGPQRDGITRGLQIKTDWSASPPVQMWRRPIGPGWSSFAVQRGRVYTQEQRGSEEIVACYDVNTGKLVWKHGDAARFYESTGGPGPRATPTLSNGRVYTLGATGILNVLNADTGAVVWSRNAVSDTGAKIPGWGISGSPLITNDLVIVAASANLAAYDIANGNLRWRGPTGRGQSYSSPQLFTIDGVPQVVLMSATGVTSVTPADGKPLWDYSWQSDTRIMQPAMTADGDLLMTIGDGMGGGGLRRIAVKQGSNGWTIEERWTSEDLNANFNDFVVHEGHVYGFDYSNVACIDVKDGKSKWKGAKYGYGQLVLLSDSDALVVLGEKGELALVKATPDQFTELARIPAIEGKTWNHPVVADDLLLVRNDHEMAAFRLSLANR